MDERFDVLEYEIGLNRTKVDSVRDFGCVVKSHLRKFAEANNLKFVIDYGSFTRI
jgi:hypothetical protein